MTNQQTVLEGIIEDVATDLYNKWSSALPENERNEEAFKALSRNAQETTLFVIQIFMNKFNAAAEQLKGIDEQAEF
jgi:hypothetical protein